MKPANHQHAPDNRRCFEFCFPALDTLIQLESSENEVAIRATRDTLSERRKMSFIHELAAEGFIPESYQRFSGFEGSFLPVRWSINNSWLKPDQAAHARSHYILTLVMAFATLRWLAMMSVLLLS